MMLNCLELLKQAMGSSQSIPYFGLKEDGETAWVSPALQAALPQAAEGENIARLLPGEFPKSWEEDEREFPLPGGGCVALTRFADAEGVCFLGRFYPAAKPSGAEQASVNLLTSQIREQASEARAHLMRAEEDIASIQENYENIAFFPNQDVQKLYWQLQNIKKASSAMLSFAMQMDEYCCPPEKKGLVFSCLNSYNFFSELFHNMTLYLTEAGLQFDAKVHPSAKAWDIRLDYRRFTAALLAWLRLSYVPSCGGKIPSLKVAVEIEGGALLLRLRDAAVNYHALNEKPYAGADPTLASIACHNLRLLVGLQNGQWLLSALPGEEGYYLQIRFPVQKAADSGSQLASPSDYLSGVSVSSTQQELVNTIFADIGFCSPF